MHFQAICQASAKNTKPQKLSSRLGENTIFKVSSFKKTTKIQHKKLQNEGTKKTSKKSLQKSISGAILGSKNPPNPSKIEEKSIQNRSRKKDAKKNEKNIEKKTCLSKWTGSAIFFKKCWHKVKRERTKQGKEQPKTE